MFQLDLETDDTDPNFEQCGESVQKNVQTTQCQNGGCSMKYVCRESDPKCLFHPGIPIFHEGYKYWSCCKRKTIAFEDFMKQKGCKEGEHCWTPKEKPTSEAEPIIETKEIISEEVVIRPKMNAMERPDMNSEMIHLPTEVSPNFQKAVESATNRLEDPEYKECQNAGCSTKYADRESNPKCLSHPGEPIFHEGLKYWSCCKKKSMEFEEFIKQKGCTVLEEHCWASKKQVDCRLDWHQTASYVIVTIYAKGYSPSGVSIKANGVRLQVSIALPTGVYNKCWTLHGIIEEANSSACLLSTKIEIKLKKAELMQWTNFEI